MPKVKTKSKLNLSKRRERSFELFAKGYTNTDVAKDLKVRMDTVAGYRALYNDRIHAQAAANPNFLREVLQNTIRAMDELDRIRADAWAHLEDRIVKTEHQCPECETIFVEKDRVQVSDQTRAQYHNVLLKAQDQRSKLMGVLGVKQEMLVAIMQVRVVQDKMLGFMGEHLCDADRAKLETFLTSPELVEYMGSGALGAIEAESVEAFAS